MRGFNGIRSFLGRFLPQPARSAHKKVSVIIPVCNTEAYLRECLDSIVNQTLREIEIICINDGSTDGSPYIIREYASRDKRIKVVTQENKGLAATRNAGIDRAEGEYIYFIDSDDKLKTEALAELYDFAEKESLDVLFFDGEVQYDSEEAYLNRRHVSENYYIRTHDYSKTADGPALFTEMMKNNEYRCSACMQLISSKHIAGHNLRFYEGILHEDDLFSFLCLMKAKRAAHLRKHYYVRRVRSSSITTEVQHYREFYGYLVGCISMDMFASGQHYSVDTQMQIDTLLNAMQKNMVSLYAGADDNETWLDVLNPEELRYAKRVLQLPHPDADMIRDVKEVVSRYGAKRVIWRAFKERIYQLCPQRLIRLYHRIRH